MPATGYWVWAWTKEVTWLDHGIPEFLVWHGLVWHGLGLAFFNHQLCLNLMWCLGRWTVYFKAALAFIFRPNHRTGISSKIRTKLNNIISVVGLHFYSTCLGLPIFYWFHQAQFVQKLNHWKIVRFTMKHPLTTHYSSNNSHDLDRPR